MALQLRPSLLPDQRARAESWLEAHRRAVLAGLASVAALVRLLYWFSLRSQPLESDAGHYHEIATYLAGGLGFSHTLPQVELHPTAFRPPLYPFLLSLVYRVVGATQGAGRVSAVVIGVAVVVATVLVLRRHAGILVGVLAGGAVALYPPLIANDTVTLTEGLSLLLLLGLVDALLRRRVVWSGVWVGLLVLTRPSAQLLFLLVGAWLVGRVGWRRAAVSVGVAAAVVAPWVLRNAVVVGEPVVVTSNGFNLAAIYAKPAQEANLFIDPLADHYYDDLRLAQFDEAGWDRELRQRALADLRANPRRAAQVVVTNTGTLFELTPRISGIAEVLDGRNMVVKYATLPLFYAVTVIGAVGLWRGRRHELASLLGILGLYFTLGSLVLVAAPRLRAPVDYVLCIGVALLVAGGPTRPGGTDPDEGGLIDLTDAAPSERTEPSEADDQDQTSPANVSV